VSNQALTILLTSIGAILVAAVGAIIGAAINSRAKIDEGLREQRLQVYPPLWAHTSIVSRWPRTSATWRDLAAVHGMLRQWYYGSGGLFMSERSRDLYGDVQVLVDWLVLRREDSADQMTGREYDYLMERCSALRTALTQDLETRSSRPMWDLRRRFKRRRWYAGQKTARRSASPSPKPSQISEQSQLSESKKDRPFERPLDRVRYTGRRIFPGAIAARAGNRDSLQLCA
jgi:hypothetical protein